MLFREKAPGYFTVTLVARIREIRSMNPFDASRDRLRQVFRVLELKRVGETGAVRAQLKTFDQVLAPPGRYARSNAGRVSGKISRVDDEHAPFKTAD